MEENILNNKRLKENPFIVPVGYFNKMQDGIKNSISNEHMEIRAKIIRHSSFMRPIVTAAASVCVAVLGVTGYVHYISNGTQKQDVSNNQTLNTYSEDGLDYILMDNEEIYSYMSGL